MSSLAGSIAPPGTMYVRALYDYDADDRTSLSFRQGETIQVITQLESGWWDGIINGVRGWFPSNYCEVINATADGGRESQLGMGMGMGYDTSGSTDVTEESDGGYGEHELNLLRNQANGTLPQLDSANSQEEAAAFWIPQATPDGRLFYFNTLTGVSTMELPLETPTSVNDNGPRDGTNVYIPDQTRPPAEMLAGGYERQDDTDYESSSDADVMMIASRGSLVSLHSNLHCASCVTVGSETNEMCTAAPPTEVVHVRRRLTRKVDGFSAKHIASHKIQETSHRRHRGHPLRGQPCQSAKWRRRDFLRQQSTGSAPARRFFSTLLR